VLSIAFSASFKIAPGRAPNRELKWHLRCEIKSLRFLPLQNAAVFAVPRERMNFELFFQGADLNAIGGAFAADSRSWSNLSIPSGFDRKASGAACAFLSQFVGFYLKMRTQPV